MNTSEWPRLLRFLRGRRDAIADSWYEAITHTGFTSLTPAEMRRCLGELTDQAIAAVLCEPFERHKARAIGSALVGTHFLSPETISRTQEVLARELLGEGVPADQATTLRPRLAALLAEIAAGYFERARDTILLEQERTKSALVRGRKQAEEALRESEGRFRRLVEHAADAFFLHDLDGRFVDVNRRACESLGYSREELLALSVPDVEENFVSGRTADLWKRMDPDVPVTVEGVHRRKDGSTFPVEARIGSFEVGERRLVLALVRDITERKQSEGLVRQRSAAMKASMDGMAILDENGAYIYVNDAHAAIFGYDGPEELLGKTWKMLYDERELGRIEREIEPVLWKNGRWRGEVTGKKRDGSTFSQEVSLTMIEGGGFVCVVRDIAERKALEERLAHQAFHDSLTGLPNRALFMDRLGHALARVRRRGGKVAVLFLDLDDFKLVNDSLGHEAGDRLLVAVSDRLRSGVRPEDTLARFAGDEFTVLLEGIEGVSDALRTTERISEELRRTPFALGGHEVFVSASIGIVLGDPGRSYPPEELLRGADAAMYRAKEEGKARYRVFDPGMNTHAIERLELENDLRRAVENGELGVRYQPIVSAVPAGAVVVGMEALVRWEHPDKGLLAPDRFIPLAEETGLIDRVGPLVLRESCRQTKEWQERYPAKSRQLSLGVCVNLSPRQIRQPDLAENVTEVLLENGLEPGSLTLEISERTAMQDAEHAIGKLRELKELGVRLALDDFGAGHCSLVYLEHPLLDIVKIDRAFIHKEKENPEECAAVIFAMLGMARSLGLSTIVEGVETAEQADRLRRMGCEMAQGFYFAKPLLPEAATKFLDNFSS